MIDFIRSEEPTQTRSDIDPADMATNLSTLRAALRTEDRVIPTCRFFKKGKCQYGDKCRFSHCDKDDAQPDGSGNAKRRSSGPSSSVSDWVNAPEFVPSSAIQNKSYASVVGPSSTQTVPKEELKMCPYMDVNGACNNYTEGECPYAHGQMCELCGLPALHPYNEEKRKKHIQVLLFNYFLLVE